jgi:hypothetical protein
MGQCSSTPQRVPGHGAGGAVPGADHATLTVVVNGIAVHRHLGGTPTAALGEDSSGAAHGTSDIGGVRGGDGPGVIPIDYRRWLAIFKIYGFGSWLFASSLQCANSGLNATTDQIAPLREH